MKKIDNLSIIYIHHTTAVGGATNSMLFTVEKLLQQNFRVTVLFLDKVGLADKLFSNLNIQVDHLEGVVNYQHAYGARIKWIGRNPIKPISQFFMMLISVNKVYRYLKKHRNNYDIVHINTSVMLPVGIACKLLGIKVVWHNREVIYKGLFGIRKFIVSLIIKSSSTKIIHISKMGENSVGNCFKNEIIYNFVDFKKFDKSIYKYKIHDELGLSHQTKIITMLGGIVHSKGADVLIAAIPDVIKDCLDVHFLIVGYPPVLNQSKKLKAKKDMSSKCLELVAENSISNNITFIGIRNDIQDILASTYMLVWPATVPHFSRPIIEAQSMGVPAIGTDFEVTREVIQYGETGLTFKNGDKTSLANQMKLLLKDSELYNKISQQAYNQAQKLFNADINVKRIINIYHSIF